MADWAAAVNGRDRNSSFRPRSCPDIFVPASCRRNWTCLIVALFAALLLLYCSSALCPGIRTRGRVSCATSAGISLADVASDRLARCRCCRLRLHSPPLTQWADAKFAASVNDLIKPTVETSRLHSVPPDRVGPVLKTCNRLIEPVNPFTLHLCGSEASISIAARHPSQSPGSGNCVVVLEVRQLMKNLSSLSTSAPARNLRVRR
jgi:hypothetical protein